ncbi:hypothetical protein ACLK1T_12275 [Escherichia coli]
MRSKSSCVTRTPCYPRHWIPTRYPVFLNEVIAKLNNHKPASIGQASRISGVTPAAISILLVWLKNRVCCVVAHNALKMPRSSHLGQRIKNR